MKLWLDDIRLPPDDSWTWARTLKEAIDIAEVAPSIEIASLDHDLGCHELDPYENGADMMMGRSEETGLDFAKWLVEYDRVPSVVIIHSWNPAGAHYMATTLRPYAHVVVQPYGQSPNSHR